MKRYFKILGPGLITGASDDDPSGITTYSQAGAQFGFMTLWTALVTFPLMVAVQGMCARIGVVTKQGLTGVLRQHYPKWILWLVILTSFPAIVLNIGADIAGMGAVATLIIPAIPAYVFCILFSVLIMLCMIFFSYQKIASILKYTCLTLIAYLIVPFLLNTDWTAAIKAIFLPQISFSKDYIEVLVAILGTTLSPYLFFWQANMEAENIKHYTRRVVVNKHILADIWQDVTTGMFFSNIVMLFIILTCGSTLYTHGIRHILTVEQAASALRPIAGRFSYYLFAIGVFGTGMLAIPVLSGSLSYILAETFGWEQGLDKKFHQATVFYTIIAISLVLGIAINYIGITPIQGLFYTAVLYGLTTPVLLLIILHICNNKRIMKDKTNKKWENILGAFTFILMTIAAILLLCLL
ncbi:NRAMP family divalent metal transporter [Chitinophaga vietnamensis]|uniref:NRAMP family divalent metal transporter n=1 Tax=Chitinophaga vietnamensis TaxID=2593957 RepID=UPI001F2096EA|nr:divalent metal cation transporter [Chitinophaga vietnamensis]